MGIRRSHKKRNLNVGALRKGFYRISAVILTLVFLVILARAVMVGKTSDRVMTNEELIDVCKSGPVDAIVVLGAGVYQDGSLSPILKNRMDRTISLYQMGLAKQIICSGDHRLGEYDEVDHMVEYLVVHKIPEENIDYDYEGFSTLESMENVAKTFGMKRIILVTQQYHLYRGIYLGGHFGMDVYGAEAEQAGVFTGRLYRTLREDIASMKDFLYCLFVD